MFFQKEDDFVNTVYWLSVHLYLFKLTEKNQTTKMESFRIYFF